MAKRLIGSEVAEKQLSNEISAPYEVPQYPIEQIETKLIRWEECFFILENSREYLCKSFLTYFIEIFWEKNGPALIGDYLCTKYK